MMSKNLSSASKRFAMPQKEILKRRYWAIGLILLLFVLYFIVGATVTINSFRDMEYYYPYLSDEKAIVLELFSNGFLYFLTTVAAMVLAIQGYAYLHKKRAVDFYESQPIKRSSHFFGILINSIIIFAISFIIPMCIGVLIVSGVGYGSSDLIVVAGLSILKNLALFLAIFAIATFASMISGNVIIAILGTGVLLLYEIILRFVLEGYASTYFSTYDSMWDLIPGPHVIVPFAHLSHEFGKGVIWHNLVIGILILLAAYFCYTKRKNEMAGTAIVFKAARICIKVALGVLVGLTAGYIFMSIYGTESGIVCALVFSFIACCIIEIIFNYNFKAMFKNWIWTIVTLIITIAIILIFVLDIFGYDSWLPKEKDLGGVKVEVNYYGDHYSRDENKIKFSKDVEPALAFAKECINTSKSLPPKEEGYDESNHYSSTVHVTYKMKNNKEVLRWYNVPKDIDEDIVNNLFKSQEYKESHNLVYFLDNYANAKNKVNVYYYNAANESDHHEVDVNELKEAYLKDLSKLDYKYALENPIEGRILLKDLDGSEPGLDVFKGFDNTFDFLKKNDMYYPSAVEESKKEKRIAVHGYAEQFDVEELTKKEDLIYDAGDGIVKKYYTEKKEIEDIIDACYPDGMSVIFGDLIKETEPVLYIEYPDMDYSYQLTFIKGKIPEFVKDDFDVED